MNSPTPVFIPKALKILDQWLVWKLEDRGGPKPSKVPYDAKTGHLAKSNGPGTWCDFNTAVKAALNGQDYDGIGFAFHREDGLAGIDIDYPWGSPIATGVVERFRGTYCERSPSEKLRVFCYGKPHRCGKGTSDKSIEVYDSSSPRYLTVTGHWIEGTGREVTDQQAALDWLFEQYFKPKEAPKPKKPKDNGPELTLGDQEIIDKAKAARNGGKFSALFYGGWEAGGYPSQSEADAALCALLVFWTRDEGQIDRIFRQSALMREKWDKRHHADGRTYGQATIERALSTMTETYQLGDHREESRLWEDPPIESYNNDPEIQGWDRNSGSQSGEGGEKAHGGSSSGETAIGTDAEAITRLAALPPLDYSRVRKGEAKRLGVRVTDLDAEVKRAREGAKVDLNAALPAGKGQGLNATEAAPWPDPIDLNEVLNDLVTEINRYAVLSAHADTAIALWIAHTYVYDAGDISPFLFLTSPVKRCGKSTVLIFLLGLVNRPMVASNISPSSIFRVNIPCDRGMSTDVIDR
jgi:hypothetical protein